MEAEQVEILKLLNKRLFTPIEVIADTIFGGDQEKAQKIVQQLEDIALLEYVFGRASITIKGKVYVNDHVYPPAHWGIYL